MTLTRSTCRPCACRRWWPLEARLKARNDQPRRRLRGPPRTSRPPPPAASDQSTDGDSQDSGAVRPRSGGRCSIACRGQEPTQPEPASAPSGRKAKRGKGGGPALGARLQQQGGQGRAERQRVERRDQRRDGDGQGELTKELPVMPLMKAHGTNTALSTRPTAMTGPDTCSIALMVASRGARPCSM